MDKSPGQAYTACLPVVDSTLRQERAQMLLECDLVMKGGVTSGTVYPCAIARLAKRYRFRSIGGTSAGAIAAAAAAAAEYRRQSDPSGMSMDGFDQLARLPAELGAP